MPYTVTIQSSGHQFTVEESESVINAALRQGIVMPYGCRNGACGKCMGTVLSGHVVYDDGRPPALSEKDAANNKALFCQAIPANDLDI
ncbi:MAG: 2Fe-2S iron-sulfur cluster binding domain-containing protein, partial [Zetaproteobacteria bacterium]|nr:2Fe-2S iron-sulfur cluster binding domain-containing protein [Zetaproteobacteria bacterium]